MVNRNKSESTGQSVVLKRLHIFISTTLLESIISTPSILEDNVCIRA